MIDTTEHRLARRLRDEREQRGWSLSDLAERSGVSKAMLSKIERSEASPTAALLGRLSAAFGLTMSQLFARVEGGGDIVARVADQPTWRDPTTGFARRSLSPPGESPLELVWGEMPPNQEVAYAADSYRFTADHQIVAIEGHLTVKHGDTVHELAPGDCLRYGTPKDTTIRNASHGRCRYIVAVLRSGKA
jgi:transcriptional regulator with XRE-family HTH domain